MKTKLLLAIVAALLGLCWGCKCDVQHEYYPIDDELLAYVFDDTSTWVYQNTTTNQLETVTLYQMEGGATSIFPNDPCLDVKKADFEMKFESSLKPGYEQFYYMDHTCLRLNGAGNFPWYGTVVYSPIEHAGDSVKYEYNYIKYVAYYDTLTIQGKTYHSVKKMMKVYYNMPTGIDSFYYWAPKVGIVRKEYYDSTGHVEFWDLIHDDIKPY